VGDGMKKKLWLFIVLVMNLGALHSAAYGLLVREPLMQPSGGLYGAANNAASSVASNAYGVAQSVLPSTAVNAASALASGAYHAGQYVAQSYQGLGDMGKKAVQLAAAGTAAYGGYKWYQRRQALSAQQAKDRAANAFYLAGEQQYKQTMHSVEDFLKREKARLDTLVNDFLRTYNPPYVRMKALLVEMKETDAAANDLLQKLQKLNAQQQQQLNAAAIGKELKDVLDKNEQMKVQIEGYIQTIDTKWKRLLDNIKAYIKRLQQNPIESYQTSKGSPIQNTLSLDDPFLSLQNNLMTYNNEHNNNLAVLQNNSQLLQKHKNI